MILGFHATSNDQIRVGIGPARNKMEWQRFTPPFTNTKVELFVFKVRWAAFQGYNVYMIFDGFWTISVSPLAPADEPHVIRGHRDLCPHSESVFLTVPDDATITGPKLAIL